MEDLNDVTEEHLVFNAYIGYQCLEWHLKKHLVFNAYNGYQCFKWCLACIKAGEVTAGVGALRSTMIPPGELPSSATCCKAPTNSYHFGIRFFIPSQAFGFIFESSVQGLHILTILVFDSLSLLKLLHLYSRVVSILLGREPVTTEPVVLQMGKEVIKIFEEARLMEFFCKFSGFNESI